MTSADTAKTELATIMTGMPSFDPKVSTKGYATSSGSYNTTYEMSYNYPVSCNWYGQTLYTASKSRLTTTSSATAYNTYQNANSLFQGLNLYVTSTYALPFTGTAYGGISPSKQSAVITSPDGVNILSPSVTADNPLLWDLVKQYIKEDYRKRALSALLGETGTLAAVEVNLKLYQ